jgi:hypothetical protein
LPDIGAYGSDEIPVSLIAKEAPKRRDQKSKDREEGKELTRKCTKRNDLLHRVYVARPADIIRLLSQRAMFVGLHACMRPFMRAAHYIIGRWACIRAVIQISVSVEAYLGSSCVA